VVCGVEYTIKVDKQGRLVLPSNIREALGLENGGHVTVRLDGRRLVLEPEPVDVKKRVQDWMKDALETRVEALAEERGESWKWMSREYAGKKLGLL
jgi:AbrB family looped-hinge helix DNA binding protein